MSRQSRIPRLVTLESRGSAKVSGNGVLVHQKKIRSPVQTNSKMKKVEVEEESRIICSKGNEFSNNITSNNNRIVPSKSEFRCTQQKHTEFRQSCTKSEKESLKKGEKLQHKCLKRKVDDGNTGRGQKCKNESPRENISSEKHLQMRNSPKREYRGTSSQKKRFQRVCGGASIRIAKNGTIGDVYKGPGRRPKEAPSLGSSLRGKSESSNARVKPVPTPDDRRCKRRPLVARQMGSNVSRHSGKGLSGCRTQSSGNLPTGILTPRAGRMLSRSGTGGVGSRDRYKFTGSLPNHLDDKEMTGNFSSVFCNGNNNSERMVHSRDVNFSFGKAKAAEDPEGGDQGYGSERELPAFLCTEPRNRRLPLVRKTFSAPFLTKENTFETKLEKGSRGLGLSVTGGTDTKADQYPGLIRIKRIYPHEPAWECGTLQLGDIILAANGVPLSGLTNHEALQILRTTPREVVLKVCRPPGQTFSRSLPNVGEPPTPPNKNSILLSSQRGNSTSMLPLMWTSSEPYGEFDLTLNKINGSLGFTLRKEDESVLGHYVRALVREPAISDGRLRPGDKIVSVNGTDISSMSHEEAVAFLRQTGDQVRLRLYRDPVQTPVSALSPTESHKLFRPKPALRKEVMDMLCDLAAKRLIPSDSSGKSRPRTNSPGSSPRRRKLSKVPPHPLVGSKVERPSYLDLSRDEPLCVNKLSGVNPRKKKTDKDDEDGAEPASMPQISSSCLEFRHKNPIYQSAHSTVRAESAAGQEAFADRDVVDATFQEGAGTQGLLKWKGVLFTPENEIVEGKKKSSRKSSLKKGKVVSVELTKGWNSRLGFSLRNSGSGTFISAIYPDSVAAKDGRLESGDQIIMINDESTRGMSTSDVIDLLRKVRGTIAITVIRED